jgi:hypothetical protein
VYRPDALRQGTVVSAAALVGLVALLVMARGQSGPPDGRPEA